MNTCPHCKEKTEYIPSGKFSTTETCENCGIYWDEDGVECNIDNE